MSDALESKVSALKEVFPRLGAEERQEALRVFAKLEKDACEASLMAFMQFFWPYVEPGIEMVEGDVLEEMCDHLEAVTAFYKSGGDHEAGIQDLLINVPPGCSKSLLVDVMWPAWEWGPQNLPHLRYFCASYSEALTLRDNVRFLNVIKSPKYQEYWGNRVVVTKESEGKVVNDKMGWKLATSVGGLGTGERGDRFLVDDPNNVKDGESKAMMKATMLWWREVVPTRLNNPDLSSKVVIMQRVAEGDISGDIITTKPEFVVLRLPMEFDPDFPYCKTPVGGEWRTERGELLWPERFNAEAVAKLKRDLGPYAVSAQFQQSPAPRGGGILKREYWQLYDEAYAQRIGVFDPKVDAKLKWPDMEFVVASLDTSYGEKEANDYNALVILGVWRDEHDLPKIMLMDCWKKRLPLHGNMPPREEEETDLHYLKRCRASWGLVEMVAYSCKRLKIDKLLIENKTRGVDVQNELVRLFGNEGLSIELINPRKDKIARAHAIVSVFSQEMVFAPDMEWAESLIENCANFPKVEHDDDCDALTQGVSWLRSTGWALRRDERELDLASKSMLENMPNTKPLYDL